MDRGWTLPSQSSRFWRRTDRQTARPCGRWEHRPYRDETTRDPRLCRPSRGAALHGGGGGGGAEVEGGGRRNRRRRRPATHDVPASGEDEPAGLPVLERCSRPTLAAEGRATGMAVMTCGPEFQIQGRRPRCHAAAEGALTQAAADAMGTRHMAARIGARPVAHGRRILTSFHGDSIDVVAVDWHDRAAVGVAASRNYFVTGPGGSKDAIIADAF